MLYKIIRVLQNCMIHQIGAYPTFYGLWTYVAYLEAAIHGSGELQFFGA
uniref:Uncharacterized protein n=1 Tax=Aegilops tauschii subsp. strangulata TaxID=200361 RepID=A0A453K9V0_AEGTS